MKWIIASHRPLELIKGRYTGLFFNLRKLIGSHSGVAARISVTELQRQRQKSSATSRDRIGHAPSHFNHPKFFIINQGHRNENYDMT